MAKFSNLFSNTYQNISYTDPCSEMTDEADREACYTSGTSFLRVG